MSATMSTVITMRRRGITSRACLLPLRSDLPPVKQNLIFDDGPRRPLFDALRSRDLPCILLLMWGLCLTVVNVLGATGAQITFKDYESFLAVGAGLALVSLLAGIGQACFDGELRDERPGMAAELSIVTSYALWGLATVWLCIRLGSGNSILPALPTYLDILDPAACILCILAFVVGVAAPAATLIEYRSSTSVALSDVEAYRMRGLIACGLPGLLYIVDAASLALGGQAWWFRVCEAWPAQRSCEQTTLLCGALAVEGCMLLHRLGREGTLRFKQEAVPAGIVLCVLLTLVPIVAQLSWRHDSISLWEFYFV